MKTKFFFFAMLASVAASAQSTVQITPISATYTSTPIIQFKVSWTSQTATNHRNKVWVFVDFQPVVSPTQKGSWQPATITTGTVQNIGGTVSEQSNRGFFLEGTTTNFASTITVSLSNVTGKFNWCAYATDYPPNIASVSSGTYTLKGTQSFILDGTTISGNKYSGSINSLTDPTGCPGCIAIRDFQFSSSSVNIPCCPNLTAIGGYCRDLAADAATYTTCSGTQIEIKFIGYGTLSATTCPSGWRRPTVAEGKCICNAGLWVNYPLWVSQSSGYDCHCGDDNDTIVLVWESWTDSSCPLCPKQSNKWVALVVANTNSATHMCVR
jgi:hypothetical protein